MSALESPVPHPVMEAINGLLATVSEAIATAEQAALVQADSEGQRALAALEQEREAHHEARTASATLVADLQGQLAELTTHLTEAQYARDQAQHELELLRSADVGTAESLETVRSMLAQVTGERDALKARLEAGELEARATAADIARLSAERDAAQTVLEALRGEMPGLRAERDAACDRAARAEGAAEALRGVASMRREPIGLRRRG
jgi:chromosome segregation ATPase